MWLLTEEEQNRLDGKHFGGEGDIPMRELVPAVAQAQVRKIVEEGEKPCTNTEHYRDKIVPLYPNCRFICRPCRAELRKEAGLGGQ